MREREREREKARKTRISPLHATPAMQRKLTWNQWSKAGFAFTFPYRTRIYLPVPPKAGTPAPKTTIENGNYHHFVGSSLIWAVLRVDKIHKKSNQGKTSTSGLHTIRKTHPTKKRSPQVFFVVGSVLARFEAVTGTQRAEGLDIFALVDDVECRCGASAVNQNARAHQARMADGGWRQWGWEGRSLWEEGGGWLLLPGGEGVSGIVAAGFHHLFLPYAHIVTSTTSAISSYHVELLGASF